MTTTNAAATSVLTAPAQVADLLESAGLTGRGGALFSTATKLRAAIQSKADRTADFQRSFAHGLGTGQVIFGLTVREVQAHDVNPGEQHALEDKGIGGRRAEGGNDFGMTHHGSSIEFGKKRARRTGKGA